MNFSKKNHSLSAPALPAGRFGAKLQKSKGIVASKKIITTLVLAFFIVTTSNAQIKNTKIKNTKILVNANTVKTDKLTQGLKINNFNKLKTFKDFEKLKIPVAQMTKEKLNAKPTRSWKIGPFKLNDGSLKMNYLYGTLTYNKWSYGGSYDNNLDELVESLNRNYERLGNRLFPISIKFRVSGGVEYRLKFKQLAERKNSNEYIFISKEGANGKFISRIDLNEQNEFNYIFKEERSQEITLRFTAIPNLDYTPTSGRTPRTRLTYYWQWVIISGIQIDRIN